MWAKKITADSVLISPGVGWVPALRIYRATERKEMEGRAERAKEGIFSSFQGTDTQ